MHEPLPERIRALELSVQRWRLVSFALMLLVISFMAIGGTFGLIFVLNYDNRREIEMMRRQTEELHLQMDRARQDTEDARQQLLMEKNARVQGGIDP
jgi:hypothetical protein